jgi:hypothetical protein
LRAQLLQVRDGLHTIARVQNRTTRHCATAQIDRSGGRSKTDGPLNAQRSSRCISVYHRSLSSTSLTFLLRPAGFAGPGAVGGQTRARHIVV